MTVSCPVPLLVITSVTGATHRTVKLVTTGRQRPTEAPPLWRSDLFMIMAAGFWYDSVIFTFQMFLHFISLPINMIAIFL